MSFFRLISLFYCMCVIFHFMFSHVRDCADCTAHLLRKCVVSQCDWSSTESRGSTDGDSKRRGVLSVCWFFKPSGIWLHPLLMIGLSQCLLGQLSWVYLSASLCKHTHRNPSPPSSDPPYTINKEQCLQSLTSFIYGHMC